MKVGPRTPVTNKNNKIKFDKGAAKNSYNTETKPIDVDFKIIKVIISHYI